MKHWKDILRYLDAKESIQNRCATWLLMLWFHINRWCYWVNLWRDFSLFNPYFILFNGCPDAFQVFMVLNLVRFIPKLLTKEQHRTTMTWYVLVFFKTHMTTLTTDLSWPHATIVHDLFQHCLFGSKQCVNILTWLDIKGFLDMFRDNNCALPWTYALQSFVSHMNALKFLMKWRNQLRLLFNSPQLLKFWSIVWV